MKQAKKCKLDMKYRDIKINLFSEDEFFLRLYSLQYLQEISSELCLLTDTPERLTSSRQNLKCREGKAILTSKRKVENAK